MTTTEPTMPALWDTLESIGLVRLRFVPDGFPFDDSYIDTWTEQSEQEREKARAELWEQIERDGVWTLIGEFRMLPYAHGEQFPVYCEPEQESGWEPADSISGLVGTDASGYKSDIARVTIEALRVALASRCPRCRRAR